MEGMYVSTNIVNNYIIGTSDSFKSYKRDVLSFPNQGCRNQITDFLKLLWLDVGRLSTVRVVTRDAGALPTDHPYLNYNQISSEQIVCIFGQLVFKAHYVIL